VRYHESNRNERAIGGEFNYHIKEINRAKIDGGCDSPEMTRPELVNPKKRHG
jgi:hypothetical protein